MAAARKDGGRRFGAQIAREKSPCELRAAPRAMEEEELVEQVEEQVEEQVDEAGELKGDLDDQEESAVSFVPAPVPAPQLDELPLISTVRIDGLVLLKIVKHCTEHAAESVSGTLLGLDVDKVLQVTNCFGTPYGEDPSQYQLDMLKQLRAVNVDNNTVGWYYSATQGIAITKAMLDIQYSYQRAIRNSVLLVFDSSLTNAGRLTFKAFRISEAVMDLYAAKKQAGGGAPFANLSAADVLEELPVKVHNSHLVHGFLFELRERRSMSCEADRLLLSASSVLDKSIEQLSGLSDLFVEEQYKAYSYLKMVQRQKQQQNQYRQRIRTENEQRVAAGKEPLPEEDPSLPMFRPIAPPGRLEPLVLSGQIAQQCAKISAAAAETLHRLYVLEAFHQK
jgi:translation initiation factor 3 subunit H